MNSPALFSTVLFLAAFAPAFAGQTIRCPATADTWVSMPPIEKPNARQSPGVENHGADKTLPIRGRDSFALLQFDVSGVKGRTVETAILRVHRENEDRVPIHTVGISTISGNGSWAEGGQVKGPAAEGESNYFYARAGRQPWSYAGSDLTDVTFGQGGSLYSYEHASDAGGGWYEITVPPSIVAALASGDQFGLMLCDEKGQTQVRHVISSRESRFAPVLVVETAGDDKAAPGRTRSLQRGAGIIDSSPVDAKAVGRSSLRPGSAIIIFGSAGDDAGKGIAAHYELRYSDKPITAENFGGAQAVPRWMLNPLAPKPDPLAISNTVQDRVTAIVEGLKPGSVLHFAARAVDKAGNVGPVSRLGRYHAFSRDYPELPEAAGTSAPLAAASEPGGEVKIWAVSDLMKIDPRSGELLEKDYPGHRSRNSVWDASARTVKLTGSRNEFVAFQLAVESTSALSGIEVSVAKPLFASSKLPEVFKATGALQLSREWFVPADRSSDAQRVWYADALIPLKGAFDLPAKDNAVPGQTVQPVFADVYIPHDAAPGLHTGTLLVRAGALEQRINIQVEVLPLTLPDKLNFVVDLNCYSRVPAPDGVRPGTPEYRSVLRAYHRVAHLHRANLDVLGYSQVGPTLPDQAPPLEAEGAATKVTSWQDWDAHFGPILDGSAFKDLPRASVPVPAIYMPFFENWPGDLRKSYRFEHPEVIRTDEEYKELITRHALEAGPIEETFSKEYQDRFSTVVSQFAQHIKDRGWLKTDYFVYFNNKYYFKQPKQGGRGISLWLLDEPNHRDDVRAISFFSNLTRRGLAKHPDVPMFIRTDISRVEWIRDMLAGQIDVNCVSRRLFEKNRYLTEDRLRFGKKFWNYASTNHPRETNVSMRAWCWRVWVSGGEAVVPWLAVSGRQAWDRAEPLTVFYTGDKFGQEEPFPSLRLKAYRRGQQDVEYLVMLAKKQGWDREAVSRAVAKALDLSGGISQSYDEDAGAVNFQNVKNADMENLRLRIAKALMAK